MNAANQDKVISLSQRINDHIIDLYNYQKSDKDAYIRMITGKAVKGNEVEQLVVIDIDIRKDLSDPEREFVRNSLLSKLSENDIIVKFCGGGLHIYTNQEDFPLQKNRLIKCYSSPQFDIDVFGSVDKNSRSLIVLPGSKVKPNNQCTRIYLSVCSWRIRIYDQEEHE
jgi:hypothetical protein